MTDFLAMPDGHGMLCLTCVRKAPLYRKHAVLTALSVPWSSVKRSRHHLGIACRYNKILMIDRRFYGSEAPNPTYIVAAEYDVANNAVRNVTGMPSTPPHGLYIPKTM